MSRRVCAAAIASIAIAMSSACGGDNEQAPVKRAPAPTRTTYPCELFTRSMAQELLVVRNLQRIGAQALGPGVEQCLYARSSAAAMPQAGLMIHADDRAGAEDSFAKMQRRISKIRSPGRYRALTGLGDRAFLVSNGRTDGEVVVVQGAASFRLRMSLRPERTPAMAPLAALAALEKAARRISATFDPNRCTLRVSRTGCSS